MRVLPLVLGLMPLVGCGGFGLSGGVEDGALDAGEGLWDDGADDGDGFEAPDDDGRGEVLSETTVALEGRVYAITPAGFRVTEPPGLDALFGEVLDRDVLVFVADETDAALTLNVSLAASDGRQDPCEAVRAFPAGDWTSNPAFEVGPGRLDTSFGGNAASFRDLSLSGIFDADGGAWRYGMLSAMLDTRELAPALGGIDDVCGLVEDLGGACTACSDGEEACFSLVLEDIVADEVPVAYDATPDVSSCR